MKDRKRAVCLQLTAFFLLLFLSAYRQLGMRYAANSQAVFYIVYIGYVLLLIAWSMKSNCPARKTTLSGGAGCFYLCYNEHV